MQPGEPQLITQGSPQASTQSIKTGKHRQLLLTEWILQGGAFSAGLQLKTIFLPANNYNQRRRSRKGSVPKNFFMVRRCWLHYCLDSSRFEIWTVGGSGAFPWLFISQWRVCNASKDIRSWPSYKFPPQNPETLLLLILAKPLIPMSPLSLASIYASSDPIIPLELSPKQA